MPTISKDDTRIAKLYAAQDELLLLLSPFLSDFPEIRLSGGTVLAREWFQHRISFDLDFFVPQNFSLEELQSNLKKTGFSTQRQCFGNDIYAQLFGSYEISGQRIDVSFIQDRFHHLFQPINGKILKTRIEEPLAIYHRKASIIIGLCPEYANGRSRARDLFDLYVLSKRIMPIEKFVSQTWGEHVISNFFEGLSNVDTLQILQDKQISAFPEWEIADDGIKALDLVMQDIGMTTENIDEAWQIKP